MNDFVKCDCGRMVYIECRIMKHVLLRRSDLRSRQVYDEYRSVRGCCFCEPLGSEVVFSDGLGFEAHWEQGNIEMIQAVAWCNLIVAFLHLYQAETS